MLNTIILSSHSTLSNISSPGKLLKRPPVTSTRKSRNTELNTRNHPNQPYGILSEWMEPSLHVSMFALPGIWHRDALSQEV